MAQERYVNKDAYIYHDSHCLYCGANYGICHGEARACRISTCLACGTRQCSVNGLSRGQCSVCFHGLLEGWSGSHSGQSCAYKGCANKAVARGRGNKLCCLSHMEHQQPGFIVNAMARRDKEFVLKSASDVPVL
jgi:hypothetical protein